MGLKKSPKLRTMQGCQHLCLICLKVCQRTGRARAGIEWHVCSSAPGWWVKIAQQKHQLVNRQTLKRVWLVYLQQVADETNCSLLVNPGSGCHRASHPEVIWTPEEWAALLATTPKINVFLSVGAAGAEGGSRPPEMVEVQPLEAAKSYLHLNGRYASETVRTVRFSQSAKVGDCSN